MINLTKDQSLRKFNTFGLDAQCRFFATFKSQEELSYIIESCSKYDWQWRVLGSGSNVIFSKNFDGIIIHPVSANIELIDQEIVVADAGVVWDDFVAWSVERELWGAENLSLIPGTVGAAPVQNIGAYGVEVCDIVEWVEYYDTKKDDTVIIPAHECRFGYRESIFKNELKGEAIVTRVAFRLSQEPRPNIGYGALKCVFEHETEISLKAIRQAVISIRSTKLPDPKEIGSAGSFFKNPVVTTEYAQGLIAKYPSMPHYDTEQGVKIPAGWLIETAGWKGFRNGDAGVHPQQALVIVNYGTAKASEILSLAEQIEQDVETKFGIKLEKEVNVW